MTAQIAPPASWDPPPHAIVLGAGISGLTAAHELADRGFRVTVYEPKRDERIAFVDPAMVPPVKLGGLAASQYSITSDDVAGTKLRKFPNHPGSPQLPAHPVAGEHGFRFFPAYYLHLWDTLMRIPVYEPHPDGSTVQWTRTPRTVFDNVNRVVTQGVTTKNDSPTLIFPRELPQSDAQAETTMQLLLGFGITEEDIESFTGQIFRYLVTSPERRHSDLEKLSAYEFFRGMDLVPGGYVEYSPTFESQLLDMPKVLAAFDSKWGDARTNITTFLQLQFQLERPDNKADGVLNGPTTDVWFDHWYRLLDEMGVAFVNGAVESIIPPEPVPDSVPPWLRPKPAVRLADGTVVDADYIVVAVDAPVAENVTAELRVAGTLGTVAGLAGYATTAPPLDGPRQPNDDREHRVRDPYEIRELGTVPWDRFQTLTGIQYFFNTEFQMIRGHMYYTDTQWGLSSVNQQGLWQERPNLNNDGYVSVLSVDIGDWNKPSLPCHTGEGANAKAARDCSPEEIALEVWRQLSRSITNARSDVVSSQLPLPAWYSIDRNLHFSVDEHGREGPAIYNHAPYLVPIVDDWDRRPGGYPWNPNESSTTWIPTPERWQYDLEHGAVWQARHGGPQVHHNSVVFAGTWTKTFTRMTSMEAACESGRHAVNAILDHILWVASEGQDERPRMQPLWKVPFGFLDQSGSVAVRVPTPLGDYCFVFDIENREPLETREARNDDAVAWREGKPNPLSPLPLLEMFGMKP